VRQAGEQHALPGRVLPAACGEHLTENHLVYLPRFNTGTSQQFADHRRAQLRCGRAAQRTLEAADGGTAGSDYHDFMHKDSWSAGQGPAETRIKKRGAEAPRNTLNLVGPPDRRWRVVPALRLKLLGSQAIQRLAAGANARFQTRVL